LNCVERSPAEPPGFFICISYKNVLPEAWRRLYWLRRKPSHATSAPDHDQFKVAVYIPVFVVQRMKDPAYLEKSWNDLSSQVKIDKVYIETYRSGTIADDANLEQVKAFFASHNVQTAGGIAYVGRGDTAGADTPDDNGGLLLQQHQV
jgi:hypothetical protein